MGLRFRAGTDDREGPCSVIGQGARRCSCRPAAARLLCAV